jgi:anti-anti-sigma factor
MMSVPYRIVNNYLIFDIPEGDGTLVGFELDDFINDILELYSENIKAVGLNLSKKNYLNSTGLGELIKVKDTLLDEQIKLVLIAVGARIKSLLDMVGVEEFFNIFDREEDL